MKKHLLALAMVGGLLTAATLGSCAEKMPYDTFKSEAITGMGGMEVSFTISLAEDDTYTLTSSFDALNSALKGGTYTYEKGVYTFTTGEKTYTAEKNDEGKYVIDDYTITLDFTVNVDFTAVEDAE